MKKIMQTLFLMAMTLGFSATTLAGSASGIWTSYDLDGVARSHVKINATASSLSGYIVEILPTKGQKPTDLCTKCKGAQQNKPKQGMMILWGFTPDGDKWTGGRVLDTDSGKAYRANISVSADSQTLYLHAYVAIPALGKTVNWKRIK